MYCHILRVRAIPTLESTDSMIEHNHARIHTKMTPFLAAGKINPIQLTHLKVESPPSSACRQFESAVPFFQCCSAMSCSNRTLETTCWQHSLVEPTSWLLRPPFRVLVTRVLAGILAFNDHLISHHGGFLYRGKTSPT